MSNTTSNCSVICGAGHLTTTTVTCKGKSKGASNYRIDDSMKCWTNITRTTCNGTSSSCPGIIILIPITPFKACRINPLYVDLNFIEQLKFYNLSEDAEWQEWMPWSKCSEECYRHGHDMPVRTRYQLGKQGVQNNETDVCEDITVCPISNVFSKISNRL